MLQAVNDVAKIAGDAAMKHFQKNILVERKHDGSPVTIADREAERRARDWVAQRFPDDGFLGEEFGVEKEESERQWIVDPIDGTKSFIRGVPLWGTLVAVRERDRVIAGAAYFPALDEMLVAAIGGGCWWNGAKCQVSTVAKVEEAVVLTTDHRFGAVPSRREGWDALANAADVARDWGDCYGYLLVATGRAEVMVDPILADWDAAALYPAIVEAGGVFTSYDGLSTPFGKSAVATNAALDREARSMLGIPIIGRS
jgi:histidinol phosphatase-like enzyme (inositol monophosphatase family)